MVLRKLSNGELVQIQLSHDDCGKRFAVVYGLGFKIKKGSQEEKEAYALAELLADDIKVLTAEP